MQKQLITTIALFMVILMALVSILMIPTPSAQAQGSPKPTPTNEGSDKDRRDNDDDDDGGGGNSDTRARQPSYGEVAGGPTVTGVVYNYSTGSPQSGLLIRLITPNQEAEAITDAQGRYQFTGIGFGKGVLNIASPAGFTPLNPGMPVTLAGHSEVNLGLYSGTVNPASLLVNSRLEQGRLYIEVYNRGGYLATNNQIEVRLPVGIEATPNIITSHGTVHYGLNTQRIDIPTIPPQGVVQLEIPIKASELTNRSNERYAPSARRPNQRPAFVNVPNTTYQPLPNIQIMFTHAQELSAQLIHVGLDGSSSAVSNPQTQEMIQAASGNLQATATVTPTVTIFPTPTIIPSVTPQASNQSVQPVSMVITNSSSVSVSQAVLVPSAGGPPQMKFNLPMVMMAMGLCMGLMLSGWQALKTTP